MMAGQAFGEKLLTEVKKENLAELLHELRINDISGSLRETAPSYLGIRPLDKLLHIFRIPQQHGDEQEAHESEHGEISPQRTRRERRTRPPEPVIEITSPSSGDGKTSLLYYITAIGILPPSLDGVHLGGKGGAVVFLDTDCRFDANRLQNVLVSIAREKIHTHPKDETRNAGHDRSEAESALKLMVNECLRHVHVFRPQSSVGLLNTLRSLEYYLLHSNQHVSSARQLHAVLLDSASAFYWQDRRETEVLSIPGVREERVAATNAFQNQPEQGESVVEIPNPHQTALETVSVLCRLQHVFSCAVLYTTWGLERASTPYRPHQTNSSSCSSSPVSFRPHLSRPWRTFPTLRLVVRRNPVRTFPPYMSIDEASRDAATRHEVVTRGEFSAWVDPWGKEGWMPGVEERILNQGSFGFWVRDSGVGLFT